jgi:3-methyladenine DNA glycosylase AlkC
VKISVEERREILAMWSKHRDWSVWRIANKCAQEMSTVKRVLESENIDHKSRAKALKRRKQQRDDQVRRDVAEMARGRGTHSSYASIGRSHGLTREWVRRLAERR